MNFSAPVFKREETPELVQAVKSHLDDILDQQIVISQMAKGITFADTENMDEYERIYIISKLVQMKQDEIDAKQKAYDEAASKAKMK